MQFRSFAVLGLAVLICGASAGCHVEYQATLTCIGCQSSSVVTGDWSCSPEGAAASAASKCFVNDVPSLPTYEERLVFNFSGCPDDQVDSLLPQAVRDVVRQAGLRVGKASVPQALEPAAAPTCPPKKVDLKVTVFQAVPVPECPGDIEVEVNYQKYISDGVFQYTTLSATVPVGGHHEFLCTDAAVDETTGNVNTIRVAVLTDLNCLGQPDMLANAYVYNTIPPDGSSLVVHTDLAANTQTHEIIPPAAPVATDAASSTVRRELKPIPDPRFSQRRDR